MRVGLFGGTFDPIHLGHLILAERCREDAGLEEVWFIPSHRPPHKPGSTVTRFEHRCEMVTLATTGQPLFRVETVEKDLPPPSYTTETLAELIRQYPSHEFHLIVGADVLPDFPTWRDPARVLEQARLIVVPRAGYEVWTPDRLATTIGVSADKVRMQVVDCPRVEIASRDVRKRVAEGKTVRFLIPRSVEEYVRERKLYRVQ